MLKEKNHRFNGRCEELGPYPSPTPTPAPTPTPTPAQVAYTFLSLEDAISSAGTFWLYGAAAALGTVRPDPRPTHTPALIPPSPAAESPGTWRPRAEPRALPYDTRCDTATLTRSPSRRRIPHTRCGSHARCPRPLGDRSRISSASSRDEQPSAVEAARLARAARGSRRLVHVL